jgi:hypothetical protein
MPRLGDNLTVNAAATYTCTDPLGELMRAVG